MTVSTAVATLSTVDELILLAWQTAGLVSIEQGTGDPGWTAKAAFGRRKLNIILSELATQGVFARFRVFHEVTLAADTDRYTLPAWVLDVVGDGAYIPPDQSLTNADSENPVTPISMAQWQALSNRANVSDRPSLMYAHRGTSTYQLELRIWPLPTEAGTIRLQVQRYNADTLEGQVTIDLEPYWSAYLVAALAYQLGVSSSLPSNRVGILKAEQEMLRDKARGKANESGPGQISLDHPTGWSR